MTSLKRITKALVTISSFITLPIMAETTVIHAGTLLSVAGQSTKQNQSVVIEDGLITKVKSGFMTPEGAKVIDLSTQFVMAGLMDMHVHLQGELGPNNDKQALRESDADKLVKSIYHAQKTLHAGFTTVRDLGSVAQESFALRDGIAKGFIEGPRVIAAGTNVAVTGGHGDVDGMSPEILAIKTAKTVCDGPFDCRRATRHAIKYGADVIKITSTGGVLSDTNTGTGQQMADDELREVVETAHSLGRKVASHAHAAAGINAALRAGVDSIEHGSYANKESYKLFKQSGAYLVPTLMAGDTVVALAKNTKFMSPAIREKAIRVGRDVITNFTAAHKAGVKIAYGTDSGVSKHGNNAYEAELMFNTGMSTMDILKSATVNSADLIGMSNQLGTIEVGKMADIIAMPKNPINDIKALQNVNFVMKGGTVYRAE